MFRRLAVSVSRVSTCSLGSSNQHFIWGFQKLRSCSTSEKFLYQRLSLSFTWWTGTRSSFSYSVLLDFTATAPSGDTFCLLKTVKTFPKGTLLMEEGKHGCVTLLALRSATLKVIRWNRTLKWGSPGKESVPNVKIWDTTHHAVLFQPVAIDSRKVWKESVDSQKISVLCLLDLLVRLTDFQDAHLLGP